MPAAATHPTQPGALLRLRGQLLLAYVRGGATQDEVLAMYQLVERILDPEAGKPDGGRRADG
jgi:hypothetical protein